MSARKQLLIVSYADQHLEAYADRSIDVRIARVPVAFDREAEATAEEVAEMLLPKRYRELWRADCLRASDTIRPLLPSVLIRSQEVRDSIDAMNRLAEKPTPKEEEVVSWTL